MEFASDLLILPFDHRASFSKGLLGYDLPLTKAQHARVSAFKQIVFDGFMHAYRHQTPAIQKQLGTLVDEEFGMPILKACRRKGIMFAVSVEKSGKEVYEFEYGTRYGTHLLAVKPTFAKVLVRYNPETPGTDNKVQLRRLHTLSKFCQAHGIHLMFELLVPATESQKRTFAKQYDTKARPGLMAKAITEILAHGVRPSVWKIEALENRTDWEAVITATRLKGGKPGIIVLGRGEDPKKVDMWLRLGAKIPEVTGFAVGRTVFMPPLVAYRDGKLTKAQAAAAISKNYSRLIRLWIKSRRK